MERKFLSDLGLEKDVIDKIMTENGNDIEAEKDKVTEAVKSEKKKYADLEELYNDANGKIESFKDLDPEKVKKEMEELKIAKETAENKAKEVEESSKISEVLRSAGVTDELSLKALSDVFKSKGLKYEDDKFLGGEDVIKSLKTTYPGHFKAENPTPPEGGAPKPNEGFGLGEGGNPPPSKKTTKELLYG